MSEPPDPKTSGDDIHAEEAQLRQLTPMILRGGRLLAMLFVGLGLFRYAMSPRLYAEHFHDLTTGVRSPAPFFWKIEIAAALRLEPRGLVLIGLAVLTATPLARVVLCAVAFSRTKNRMFVGLTMVVMALLGVAMILGRIG
jgi:uncharacterized membrane protein